MVEEIGLRVDGLHVKLEEELTTALAEERKTRGKASDTELLVSFPWFRLLGLRISDVCQYIEHVVALQDVPKRFLTRFLGVDRAGVRCKSREAQNRQCHRRAGR